MTSPRVSCRRKTRGLASRCEDVKLEHCVVAVAVDVDVVATARRATSPPRVARAIPRARDIARVATCRASVVARTTDRSSAPNPSPKPKKPLPGERDAPRRERPNGRTDGQISCRRRRGSG